MAFPPSLKGVTKAVRNLPADPVVDASAPEPAGDDSLTCPHCGAPFKLSAVAAPSSEPPAREPAQVDAPTEGPRF